MHLDALVSFSLDKLEEEFCFFGDVQWNVLLYRWPWSLTRSIKVSLPLKNFRLNGARGSIDNQTALFTTKNTEFETIDWLLDTDCVNMVFIVIHSDFSVF